MQWRMSDDNHTFHIYVDESSKSADHFAVGAVFCRRDAAREIAGMVTDCCVRHNQRSDKEIHWTELKNHLLPLYTEVSTSLIGFTQKKRKMRYRALLVEKKTLQRRPDKNREEVIATFIFTLVFRFAADFGPNINYHVFIDAPQGDEGQNVPLRHMLNNRCKSKLGFDDKPFLGVSYVRSEKSRLIQAADLLTGAIAYEMNGQHQEQTASKHKRALWEALLRASGLKTFARQTPYWPKTFQILPFDARKSDFLQREK